MTDGTFAISDSMRFDWQRQDQRAWAAKVLDLPAETNAEETAAVLLVRLEQTGFLPPHDWHPALDVFCNEDSSLQLTRPAEYYHDRLPQLQTEIRGFVLEFFSLRPRDRVLKCEYLTAISSNFPSCYLKLHRLPIYFHLTPDFTQRDSHKVVVFGKRICQTLIDPIGLIDHELSRQIRSMQQDPLHWQPIAKTFRQQFPAIAKLAPQLVGDFADRAHSLQRTISFQPKLDHDDTDVVVSVSRHIAGVVLYVFVLLIFVFLVAINS